MRLARLLVNGDESEFPAFDAAVRSLLPMNTPEEQTDVKAHYEIIRQLPPVKCRLVDGRIAEYRPLEEPPPQGRAHRFAVGSVVGGTLGVLISASALAAMRRDARSDAARDPERPEAPLNGNGGVELHVMFAETVDHPESKEPVAREAHAEEDEAIAGPSHTEPLQGQGPTKEATEESAGNGPGLTPI